MPMDAGLMQQARRDQDRAVRAHRARQDQARQALYGREPRLRALDERIRAVFLTALARLSPEAVERAAQESLALQQERRELLSALNAPEDALSGSPLCPLCRDTGVWEGRLCECLAERVRRRQIQELSHLLDLNGQSFPRFDLSLFSQEYDPDHEGTPRENMEHIYHGCLAFARNFGRDSQNLLFSGPPGTGKTFLSACIAGEVAKGGFSVVYDTVIRQLNLMEAERFGRGGEEAEQAALRLRACDLLIMDDLGTEHLSPFKAEALMDLVNRRLIEGRKMLISTNLSPEEVAARYTGALASRLQGSFLWLTFFGADLRKRDALT